MCFFKNIFILRFLKSVASNILTDKQTRSVQDTIYAKAASAKSFKTKATLLIRLLNKDTAANRTKCIKCQTSAHPIPPIRLAESLITTRPAGAHIIHTTVLSAVTTPCNLCQLSGSMNVLFSYQNPMPIVAWWVIQATAAS